LRRISYLTQHIPDKYFKIVRGYGIFSNRLKGVLLPKAKILLNQSNQQESEIQKRWRERQIEYTGKDPLICENCETEMVLIEVCFGNPKNEFLSKIGYCISDRIPSMQIKLISNST
jgi:hypothetical protein